MGRYSPVGQLKERVSASHFPLQSHGITKDQNKNNANLQKATPKKKVKYNVICHYSHKITKNYAREQS